MNNLCWLAQIRDLEREWVGEKAFLLSQALQSKLPILPGFVIGSQVSQEFFANLQSSSSLLSNLALFSDNLNNNNYQDLQALAIASRHLVLNSKFSAELLTEIVIAAQQLNASSLIIRPSLCADQLPSPGSSSLINSQICFCNSQAIAQTIKSVWADLFAIKNLFYLHQLGIEPEQIKLAILVQPINNAIASGVVTINSQTARIHASWGLGYGLNIGEVDPDRYRVNLDLEPSLDTESNNIDSIGRKRRGYRLVTQTSATKTSIYPEPYATTEKQQQKVLLSPPQLQQLGKLSKQLTNLPTPITYWEWILTDKDESDSEEFMITQLKSQAPNLQEQYLASAYQQNIVLRGIPAAIGTVTSEVFVSPNLNDHLKPNTILVTKSIEPQHLKILQDLSGIVTEQGGQTSHSAIIAREMGIPAVVAAKDATSILQTGTLITLDGTRGIIIKPATNTDKLNKSTSEAKTIIQHSPATQLSQIPLATKLLVTISQPDSIEQAKNLPVEGVGLLRSEFMLMKMLTRRSLHEWLQPQHKSVLLEYLIESIGKFVQEFSPRPIYYRSLDYPLIDSIDSNQHDPQQRNRGTYAYIQDSAIFELELAALTKIMESRPSNLKLILPFVRSLREWHFCQNLVHKSGLPNYPNFQLWIMLEVPSLIFMLPEYIESGVEGVAIGMNDLTPLLCGTKRDDNGLIKQNLTGNFLAIERAITQIIQTTKENRIPCSICLSDQSGNLDFLEKLVRWGINMISVEPHSVFTIHQGIMQAERRLIENI